MAKYGNSNNFDTLVDLVAPGISDHPNTNFDLSLASWMGSSILNEYQVKQVYKNRNESINQTRVICLVMKEFFTF